jgi:hypothetical protein
VVADAVASRSDSTPDATTTSDSGKDYGVVTDTVADSKTYSVGDSACQWTFGPRITYAGQVGEISPSIGVADLNHDGVTDLTVLAGNIGVLLGHGDGTFAPEVTYAAGQGTWSLALADFDGDGNLDVAESNLYYQTQSINILFGDGRGGFGAPVSYPAEGPEGIAAADFDGDGHPDIAYSISGGSMTVGVRYNSGDGTFGAPVTYPADKAPSAVNAADFNGDGHMDFVVECYAAQTVDVFINQGDGTFAPEISYNAAIDPEAMTVGDVNGDGHPDIVVANTNGNSVGVLLNHGDGTFAAEVKYDTGYVSLNPGYLPSMPQSVTVGDFNGDGVADLGVGNSNDNTIGVFLGRGDGTFAPQITFSEGYQPSSVVAGDFNGDGLADLAFGARLTYGGRDLAIVVLLSRCQ